MIEIGKGSSNVVWITDDTPMENLQADLGYIVLRVDEMDEENGVLRSAVLELKKEIDQLKRSNYELISRMERVLSAGIISGEQEQERTTDKRTAVCSLRLPSLPVSAP